MDLIRIKDLSLRAHIGVTEEERASPQDLLLQIDIKVNTVAAGRTDDLVDTVDYGAIALRLADLVGRERPKLLERLADRIAREIARFPGVQGVTVEIEKVDPPIPLEVGKVAVRIERNFSG